MRCKFPKDKDPSAEHWEWCWERAARVRYLLVEVFVSWKGKIEYLVKLFELLWL